MRRRTESTALPLVNLERSIAVLCMTAILLIPLLAWKGFPEYMHLKQAALHLFAILVLGLTLLHGLNGLRGVFRGYGLLPLLLIASLAIPLVRAPNLPEGAGQLATWISALVLGGCCALYARRGSARVWLWGLVLSGSLVAVFGLLQLIVGLDWFEQTRAPAATFSNKNMAAQWLVLTWPAVLVAGLNASSLRGRSLVVMAGFLMVSYLAATGTKAAILAFIAECSLFAVFVIPSVRRILNGRWLLAGFVVLCLLCISVSWILKSVTEQTGESRYWRSTISESWNVRKTTWKGGLSMFVGNPFGVGAGQFPERYPAYATSSGGAQANVSLKQHRLHNDWLQLVIEGGIPALLVLGAMAFVTGKIGWQYWATATIRRGALSDPLSLLALMGLVGLATNAFFSFPLYRVLPPLMGAFYFGLLIVNGTGTGQREKPHHKWMILIGIILLAAVIPVGYFHVKRLTADKFLYRQVQSFDTGNHEQSLRYGERALASWPLQAQAREMVGRALIKQGRFEEAEAVFNRLLDRSPLNGSHLFHKTLCLLGTGDFAEAEPIAEDLSRRFPAEARIHFVLGSIYFQEGAYDRAYAAFHEASRLEPGQFEYVRNLGIAAWRAGWPGLARHAFEYCLRLDPENAQIKDWLERLPAAE